MSEERVVARVRIRFRDGHEHEIGFSLDREPAPQGPYYRGWVYLPEGATFLGRTAERQSTADGEAIKIDVAELASLSSD